VVSLYYITFRNKIKSLASIRKAMQTNGM
jgi:hypothetical protein